MSVADRVQDATDALGLDDWRSALALELAQIVDDRSRGPVGRVTAAKELRDLMFAMAADSVIEQADGIDDLKAKRAKRQAS